MKKIQLKVEFNDKKLKAIKVSLKEKNKDFDTEILKFLNGLYSKSVPKSLKKYIESDLEPEEKTEAIKENEKINEEIKQEGNEEISNKPLENNNNMR
ncbi:DUF6103 family protein [Clostridium estertheticum]|uniref:Uncharacterized protein n=1 Tax=Clostridium estertheticum subsp. estertheticum TaxID=1552 RepID=A0A1J0GNC8_9CLOT|nr:DUF6103 family protein [Clostridium estertheticum]APC42817.1 hypothetical protein A7L45_22010 [Clostridium estertheticum subsp. estertheticum]MCB2357108.1 DUF6103 family protein [Clostridium estertheticum]MCB2362250.1 DUF6103 family protein [Clostridium estertheticum]WAG44030.1 DUF6103 family protein [Clostridium estertheticum]